MEDMMQFKQELVDKLLIACKEGKTITIKGVNYFGTEFTTHGVIDTDDSNKPAIFADSGIIMVDVGHREQGQKRSHFYAPFRTSMADSDNSLVILSMEIDGEVVYKNPKRLSIMTSARREKKKQAKRIDQNETRLDDTSVAIQLENMVGKPVMFEDGFCGVFIGSDWPEVKDALPTIYVKMGFYTGMGKFTDQSILYTEDENGEMIEIADNTKMDIFSN